jgi:predicted alpha/beta-fold hydrolase
VFLNNPWYEAQFLRTIGHAVNGGADLGECLNLCESLNHASFDLWYDLWFSLAEKNYLLADDYSKLNLNQSAYNAYLRASNYYRTSYFFLDENPFDERIVKAYRKCAAAFEFALQHGDKRHEKIVVPYEDIHLSGYLFLPHDVQKPPVLIDTGGGDATKEELFFNTTVAALQHGFASFIFDGPGQGEMLRIHRVPFRPDWEAVISAVVDTLKKRTDIAVEKIFLSGTSFGGYLAPRAASYEHRLAGCIADPGIYDTMESQISCLPMTVQKALNERDSQTVDAFFDDLAQKDKWKSFLFESRKIRFGVDKISELFFTCLDYTLAHCAKQIDCPMLVLDNDNEHITPGQATRLYDEIDCEKVYYCFKAKDGHGGHCQPLSRNHANDRVFRWLKNKCANL